MILITSALTRVVFLRPTAKPSIKYNHPSVNSNLGFEAVLGEE